MQFKNALLDIGLRLGMGTVFLVAGISKLPMHTSGFTEYVVAYKILPLPLAHMYASVLPCLEIVIGTCFILGLFIRVFSLISIPIIISFIVANASALSLGLGEECACFGEIITMHYEVALLLDALLLIGVLLIFSRRRHILALDSWLSNLFRPSRHYFS